MTFLDTLEARFTRRPQPKPLSAFAEHFVRFARWLLLPALPNRDLSATNCYSLSLYLRCALGIVARISLAYYILWLLGFVWIALTIWHSYPWLFHGGRIQARIWHGMWPSFVTISKKFILFPFVPLTWALFSLILWLPRVHFWNRRARRLQSEDTVVEEIATAAAPNISIWPPPPRPN